MEIAALSATLLGRSERSITTSGALLRDVPMLARVSDFTKCSGRCWCRRRSGCGWRTRRRNARQRTSLKEAAFHKWVELAEVGWFEEDGTYDDYLADFSVELHDIRDDDRFADCLGPDKLSRFARIGERLLDVPASADAKHYSAAQASLESGKRSSPRMPRLCPQVSQRLCGGTC